MKTVGLLLGVLLAVAALLLLAGQLGFFAGKPPQDLGVRDGRLKPLSPTPNSVSSQAGDYADHPQRSAARPASPPCLTPVMPGPPWAAWPPCWKPLLAACW